MRANVGMLTEKTAPARPAPFTDHCHCGILLSTQPRPTYRKMTRICFLKAALCAMSIRCASAFVPTKLSPPPLRR
jgi:hypothetical protein